jgi:hypothetical protein
MFFICEYFTKYSEKCLTVKCCLLCNYIFCICNNVASTCLENMWTAFEQTFVSDSNRTERDFWAPLACNNPQWQLNHTRGGLAVALWRRHRPEDIISPLFLCWQNWPQQAWPYLSMSVLPLLCMKLECNLNKTKECFRLSIDPFVS